MARRKRKPRLTRKQRWRRRLLIWGPIVLVVGFCWPLVFIVPSSSNQIPDPVKITNYAADYQVAADGNMTAVEVITGLFPNGRHGIFRYWDTTDPRNPGIRYQNAITSVTIDGHPEQFETSTESAGRYTVAKIGSPDALLTAGTHVYEIRYSVTGVISPANAGPVPMFVSAVGEPQSSMQSVFWWNIVANGWRMPIEQAQIVVHLPGQSLSVQCSAAVTGEVEASHGEGPCSIAGAGTNELVIGAAKIPEYGGVTLRAGLAQGPPPVAQTPWPWQLDPVLGRSLPRLTEALLLALGAVVLGFGWAFATRERAPGLPVMYEPPAGLGPVQTVYLCDEGPGEHDLAATIFSLGQSGLLKVETKSRSWAATATSSMTPDAIAGCDPIARAVLESLELTEPEAQFRAYGSIENGRRLSAAHSAIKKAARGWASQAGLTRISIIGLTGRVVWLAAIPAALLRSTTWLVPTAWALIPLGFIVGGYRLMAQGATRRRSRAGRELWSRAGGFRRMLSTPSAQLRFDFSARRELFLPYLPYAVAFGVAKEWAQKYAAELDEPVPTPDWINNASGRLTTPTLVSMVGSFESTVRSTIGAYQSSGSSASSSGGGGSSVGSGGGGGGGGGSW